MTYLAELLDDTARFVRRFVVVDQHELDAVALWTAHTYVFECSSATPYLHPFSPEPGSGKTTLLDVLALITANPISADNLTEAVLFRLIHSKKPTLLFDEVDAVFAKKNSDSSEGIRAVLNSGYRRGKLAYRCVPPSHEVQGFDVYCPKATAGLNELPATLATRSIPIAMKPPLPTDVYEDLDVEEHSSDGETLQIAFRGWADHQREQLSDPRLKPAKLADLPPRGNEIWRILFRIADLAGSDWQERARTAAVTLSGAGRQQRDASAAVRLLGHIRDVFVEDRMFCRTIVDLLNADEELPYGGWNSGNGISPRELGHKVSRYDIPPAKTIRIGGERANGYERKWFEEAWQRYTPLQNRDNRDNPHGYAENGAVENRDTHPFVTDVEKAANPHEYSDVTVVTVPRPGMERSRTKRRHGTARLGPCNACGGEKLFRHNRRCKTCGTKAKWTFACDECDLAAAA